MKLFAFKPNGHGPYSFFVMAENEEQAKKSVQDHINKFYPSRTDGRNNPWRMETNGWGTDDYEMSVYEENEVAENCND